MLSVPTPPIYHCTWRLPRLASDGVGSVLPACDGPERAPVWLRPGLVCLPSVPLPLTAALACLPICAACVPLSSYPRRSREAPLFRGLDRLAVHAGSARSLFSTISHSQLGTQSIVYALPHSGVTPLCKAPVDNLPGWKVVGQHPPGAAAPKQVEYGIDYLSQFVSALSSDFCRSWKEWLKPVPLLVRQVAWIGWSSHSDSLPYLCSLCQYC